jgi:hypothetical protein
MTEKVEVLSGATDAEHAATEIAYCPNLGLYHYKRADGSELIFDRVQLEMALASYLKQGVVRMAEFMSMLTGYARRYPHVFVILLPDGTYGMRKMEIPEEERVSGIIEEPSKPTVGK